MVESVYQVFPANHYIARFIYTYLNDVQYAFLFTQLSRFPQLRSFWGKTKYKYIIVNNIYFLYEIDEEAKLVIILGIKFNNARKRFNFAMTTTQIRTIEKWIADHGKYFPPA